MSLPRHAWDLLKRRQNARYGELIGSDRSPHVERRHAFVIFRMGLDVCAVCKKTRKEHE
jgi:hypothetical protein